MSKSMFKNEDGLFQLMLFRFSLACFGEATDGLDKVEDFELLTSVFSMSGASKFANSLEEVVVNSSLLAAFGRVEFSVSPNTV